MFQGFTGILRKRLILQENFTAYSEICIFCVIQYIDFQKQSVGDTLKVLLKSLKTIFDEVHFVDDLYSFPYPWSPKQTLPCPQVSHLIPSDVEQLLKVLLF